jgi:hypothetical protein
MSTEDLSTTKEAQNNGVVNGEIATWRKDKKLALQAFLC